MLYLCEAAFDQYMNDIFHPELPNKQQNKIQWGELYGCSRALAMAQAVQRSQKLVVVITPDTLSATQIAYELRFFLDEATHPILQFPDWETLPYDMFSPHQDIISLRIRTLNILPNTQQGVLICPVASLMNRLSPQSYINDNSFLLNVKSKLDITHLRKRLTENSYACVSQVFEHGEFAIRGAIIDIFPMTCDTPFRIELCDDEIESMRSFDPETQRSLEKVTSIDLLPAKEIPLTDEAVTRFRMQWRENFPSSPRHCSVYQDVTNGLAAAGIEYYIPFFFEKTVNLLDYIPENSLIIRAKDTHDKADEFWKEIERRHEQLAYDITRPLLKPHEAFFSVSDVFARLKDFAQVEWQETPLSPQATHYNFATTPLPCLNIQHQLKNPLEKLQGFLKTSQNRLLFFAETTGRREALLALFKEIDLTPTVIECWNDFLGSNDPYCLTVFPLDKGFVVDEFALISEPDLFGQKVLQRRRRKKIKAEADAVINNLAELKIDDPVVHVDHGVGRYLGLQILDIGQGQDEYLTLEYLGRTKLYVPVASLHLISRYSGSDTDTAPLHKLGNDTWDKAKRKAAKKIYDVAAELLDIYARRAANKGFCFNTDDGYQHFSEGFAFEETPDQETAIQQVLQDMQSDKTMDRLVCGDVGFGKTEVAMRAAFVAVNNGKQVAILAPTTLLAQQHFQTFKDRFADWPVNIDVLSRFRTPKQQKEIMDKLKSGRLDIVIGTHKLFNKEIQYAELGLLVVDEEHRFGVKQKEMLKSMRSSIDILTLTATPIPRTLNMAFAGMRDLSIIATPPPKRLAIKTFLHKRSKNIIREAILREILRGGQVYFLHNKVETIRRVAEELSELVPEARIAVGHGQLREKELEQVMTDFYHRQFNVLVCTTIIETGIDVPNANTMLIDRADKFGLAQLHQLRGRVGRSHHQAYAYLLIPDENVMTKDAEKRLEAITAYEDLGIGFTLATHDLEIRGAGELLGDEQSGQIQEVGFNFYMNMLDRAIKALRAGETLDLNKPLDHGAVIEIKISAIIPEDYLADIHLRLVHYKRIASAKTAEDLDELEVEIIDRFGLLPPSLKNLFAMTHLKLKADALGIKKVKANKQSGRLYFSDQPNIDPRTIIELIQSKPNFYKLESANVLFFKLLNIEKDASLLTAINALLINLTGSD
jgi:transcription-repair coupling factor (superfamily II helicase)